LRMRPNAGRPRANSAAISPTKALCGLSFCSLLRDRRFIARTAPRQREKGGGEWISAILSLGYHGWMSKLESGPSLRVGDEDGRPGPETRGRTQTRRDRCG